MRYTEIHQVIYTEDGQVLETLPKGDHEQITLEELVPLQHEALWSLLQPVSLNLVGRHWTPVYGPTTLVFCNSAAETIKISRSTFSGVEVEVREYYPDRYSRRYFWNIDISQILDKLKADWEENKPQ